MSRPGTLLKFPGMISIEQLMLVVRAQEERIRRLETLMQRIESVSAPEHSGTKRGNGRRTRAQELENRRQWIDAMDAYIAGDVAALTRFTESGGWTPPREYR